MPLPTGTISMSQVNTELGLSATTTISLNQANVRSLAGVASGTISMNNLRGKSAGFAGTISTNQVNLNLRTWALANGWNGTTPAQITVASNVYVYSTSTATPGLTIDGSWPGGITLVNDGFIMGMGGRGGWNAITPSPSVGLRAGTAGGVAISLGTSVSIINNSFIGGGGGGGGSVSMDSQGAGGGGAGGGEGGGSDLRPNPYPVLSGGVGGAIGQSGGNGSGFTLADKDSFAWGSGGGGGRVFPGVGGASPAATFSTAVAGLGGTAGGSSNAYYVDSAPAQRQAGATGGSAGNAGTSPTRVGGGGGGWGASGGSPATALPFDKGAPGAGGRAIALNGFTANRTGAGTTYGAVS